MLKKIMAGIALSLALSILAAPISAVSAAPYQGYGYDYWKVALLAPLPYVPGKIIYGEDLGIDNFLEPSDLYVKNDKIYLLDSGRNQLVVFNPNNEIELIVSSYVMDGAETSFNTPTGVFVTDDDEIYIADSENRRVVVLDKNGQFLRAVQNPQSDSLGTDFIFNPQKIAVDKTGRLFVIAKNVFEGIMCFNSSGEFFGYFGTIKVSFNPIDYFWRSIATKEQRAQLALFIPTEFSGIDIDTNGFVYATNVDQYSSGNLIKKLNPRGSDVLVNYNTNRDVMGDYISGDRSIFRDIKYRDNGIYSAMDFNRGRIFTYDSEGNLLYIFGGLGTAEGLAKKPAAIDVLSDDTMLLLDQSRGAVLFFAPTEYGSLINEATRLRYSGDEASAVILWQKVLDLDANNLLANIGIGKSYLAANENKKAMEYLKKGMDIEYYSVAFKRYRNDVLRSNLPYILTGMIAAAAGYAVFRIYKRRGQVKA